MISNNNFMIESLDYIPMGYHNPMQMRPYIMNTTADSIDTIVDKLVSSGGSSVTTDMVAGVSSQILQPSAVGYTSDINNEWVSTKRFTFLLKVKYFDPLGSEINSYIQGYTDHDGISPSGAGNLDMVHTINSIIETITHTQVTPLATFRKERMHKIYNVIGGSTTSDSYTQRPSDVMQNSENIELISVLQDPSSDYSLGYDDEIKIVSAGNYLQGYTNNTISSAVSNNIASEYLSRTLNVGLLNYKSREINLGSFGTPSGSYSGGNDSLISSRLPEPTLQDNRFVKYLSKISGFMSTREKFTLRNLVDMDPTIYDRFRLIKLSKLYVDPTTLATPEVGEYWTGQDPITVKAYSLIEASVATAIKYGFNKIHFIASNMSNPTGVGEIYITNFASFINVDDSDLSYLLEFFKSKFLSDILISETYGGVHPIHMEMYIDLMGTTKVKLSYAGSPEIWYTAPTIANSSYAPVLTLDTNTVDLLSQGFRSLVEGIGVGQRESMKVIY